MSSHFQNKKQMNFSLFHLENFDQHRRCFPKPICRSLSHPLTSQINHFCVIIQNLFKLEPTFNLIYQTLGQHQGLFQNPFITVVSSNHFHNKSSKANVSSNHYVCLKFLIVLKDLLERDPTSHQINFFNKIIGNLF